MSSNLTVRPMTIADASAVVELANSIVTEDRWITRQTGEEYVEGDFLQAFDVPDSAEFVATIDGNIVGLVRLRKEPDGKMELGMAVGKKYRRQGVGKALLEVAIEWARKRAERLYLTVYSHNLPAIELYRRNAFAQADYRAKHLSRKSGEVWDLIVMMRELDGVDDLKRQV